MQQLILLVVALPIVSAVLTQLFSAGLGRRAVTVSIASAWLTFLFSALALWSAFFISAEVHEYTLFSQWGVIRFDSLSALMSALIATISLIVHLYSVRYMAEEPGYTRFFSLLSGMTGTLLLMVAAGDLITLLIAWHLVGVLLYFLLGFDTRSRSAFRYAFWTWITYRFGDLPLLLAAVLLYHAFDSWSLSVIFERLAAAPDTLTIFQLPLAEVVGSLVALAAFARSAQFLLHTWLPYSMSGPTPVSALMHAGIVNAGGFLINRFAPVFVETSSVLHWVFVVGLVTAVFGSVLMLTQNDIKKALGYSTMGQMGFMIMECGVGAFSLAIYHLIAHGFFKGTLFLSSGGIIGQSRKNCNAPKDPLYNFIVEKNPARGRKPWLLMAAMTLLVPIAILLTVHWLVEQDFYQKQGAIVLLFFGWITGAQLIFSTYRLRTDKPGRLISQVIVSFAVVIVGYILISHAFDQFLYPDEAFRARIYAAATIDVIWFDVLVVLMTAVIVAGWLRTYYNERNSQRKDKAINPLWLGFYALISREFYINDLYVLLTRRLDALATRLNVWLRWV
ncbi:MAG: proton-conducting transporter membrane subunit [Gallionella sp.]